MAGRLRTAAAQFVDGGSALVSLIAGIGYIGARFAEHLLARGEMVVGVDNLFASDPLAIEQLSRNPSFRFVRGSVLSPATLARAFAFGPFDTVYDLAAQSSAQPEAATPRYTETTNLLGPRLLLDRAADGGAPTYVFASGMRVYGPVPPWQADENDL